MEKFRHIIPLGSFCACARVLETMGLRDSSYPFDWMLTFDFGEVLELLENGFDGFLDLQYLTKEEGTNHCINSRTGIQFYHDFTVDGRLEDELPAVREKYARRIARLYSDMKEPTLFVRYCRNSGEYEFIMKNIGRVEDFLRSGNPANRILLVHSSDRNALVPGEGCVIEATINQEGDDYAWDYVKAVPGLGRFLRFHSAMSGLEIAGNVFRYYYSHTRRKILRSINFSRRNL